MKYILISNYERKLFSIFTGSILIWVYDYTTAQNSAYFMFLLHFLFIKYEIIILFLITEVFNEVANCRKIIINGNYK